MTQVKATRKYPAKHGGTITLNLSGSATLQYWLNGRQTNKTFRDQVDQASGNVTRTARLLAEDFSLKLAVAKRQGDATFGDRSRGDVPFTEYCERWIDRGQKRGEATKGIYRSTLRRIEAKLAGRSLAWVALHRTEIEDIINALGREPRGASYVRRARVIIVGTCKAAVVAEDIPRHNLTGLDIGADQRVNPARFYPAEHAELEKLAAEIGEQYALAVWLGRYAGLRCGESLGVNKADVIDAVDGEKVLVLQRQRLADGTLAPMKARKATDTRTIPVGVFLAARLAAAATDADGYYFPAQWRRTVMDKWEKSRDAAGLPKTFTTHALRHLYATHMLSMGARLDLVSKILGHKSVEITSTVYAHWLPSDYAAIRALEMAA
jgi:integrase